eukprot:6208001-Pleurochrysis_carterae.AAC.1
MRCTQVDAYGSNEEKVERRTSLEQQRSWCGRVLAVSARQKSRLKETWTQNEGTAKRRVRQGSAASGRRHGVG